MRNFLDPSFQSAKWKLQKQSKVYRATSLTLSSKISVALCLESRKLFLDFLAISAQPLSPPQQPSVPTFNKHIQSNLNRA